MEGSRPRRRPRMTACALDDKLARGDGRDDGREDDAGCGDARV